MNQFFTNLFKALGVLALSALIFFLFEPKKEIKDQAMNLALEFLGKKLLAMAPSEEDKREIETKFEAMSARAQRGEINDENLQEFATFVLNAEAEGEPLDYAEIDSSLTSLNENEALLQAEEKKRMHEERRLEQWAARMQDFERFEKRWHTLVPDSPAQAPAHARHRPPPRYRLSKQFVVQIDSAALAHAIGIAIAPGEDSLPPRARAGHFPPPHFTTIVRELEGDLRGLRVELQSQGFEQQWQWADSLRARARSKARREQRGVIVTPQTSAPPAPETHAPPRKN